MLPLYTCWSISRAYDGVFTNQTKNFRFIHCLVFIIIFSVFIANWPETCEKMQWLQKAQITVIYSQDITLDHNRICLSLFFPSQYSQSCYFSDWLCVCIYKKVGSLCFGLIPKTENLIKFLRITLLFLLAIFPVD